MTILNQYTGLPYLPEDVPMRLSNCVVMYDDKPVMIGEVTVDGDIVMMNAKHLSNGMNFIIELPDDKLSLRPVPVGYVNHDKQAVYVSRNPVRRYKQGLHHQNVRLNYAAAGGGANLLRAHGRQSDVISGRGMSECIHNSYFSMADAIRLLEDGDRRSVAFHRKWAVSEDDTVGLRHLFYRGREVGTLTDNGPILGKKYRYLAEEIERMQA